MTEPQRAPVVIEPIDFRQRRAAPRPRGRWRRRVVLALLAIVVLAIAGSGWFVLTASQVSLVFEPGVDEIGLQGPRPQFKLSDRYLLRHGTYEVNAALAGHHPLNERFEVAPGRAAEVTFTFEELPGIIELRVVDARDGETLLEGARVEIGEQTGTTPMDRVELPRGTSRLQADHDRYQALESEIEVEGFGAGQTHVLALRPDWADVEITTLPVRAAVFIDGAEVASTPCRIEVASGKHDVELRADGFELWTRRLVVVAEKPLALTDIALEPARGVLSIETMPPGAQITVDGEYAGVSPVDVRVAPDEELVVRAALAGHDGATETVRLHPAEEKLIELDLVPRTGLVRLEVDPPGAELFVDGEHRGIVPSEIELTAVEHELEFEKAGFESVRRVTTPRPGVPERLIVKLPPVEVPAEDVPATPEASNGYDLVRVEPASFLMGASRREQGRRSNETLRSVKLERAFYIGVHEVTNEEFRQFEPGHEPKRFEEIRIDIDEQPVAQVDWDDAARYCNWLSAKDGLPPAYTETRDGMKAVSPLNTGYRLPTEAEWEYVARANGAKPSLKFAWGNTFPPRGKAGNYADASAKEILGIEIKNYDDGFTGASPAGTFPANALGVHDLGGNVSEWCHDHYTVYPYDGGKVYTDPSGPATGQHHVVRGASWREASMTRLRLAYRDYSAEPRPDLGFRIARYVENENEDAPDEN